MRRRRPVVHADHGEPQAIVGYEVGAGAVPDSRLDELGVRRQPARYDANGAGRRSETRENGLGPLSCSEAVEACWATGWSRVVGVWKHQLGQPMRLNLGILRYGWLVVGSLLVACDDTTGPSDSGLRLSTLEDRLVLPAQGVVDVSFTITNRGETSAFLSRCGDRIMSAIDRKGSDGSWAQYNGDMCLAIYDMSPLEIAPGESLHGMRGLHEVGTYRLRIGTSSNPSATAQWTTVSDSFTVK